MNTSNNDFENIRSCSDEEINRILRKITSEPIFQNVLNYFFPDRPNDEIISEINAITSTGEYQKKFIIEVIRSVIRQTTDGLTHSGFENLDTEKAYLFIANHRDITFDSAVLQLLLFNHGHRIPEIAFGSNLLMSELIINAFRVNRTFMVIRDGTKREMLNNSKQLSTYIRHTITERNTSVWIAQRNGRAKDGNDKTEPGLLKMLNMSGSNNFTENFKELNLVPVTISYEYEPCDVMKVKELYASQNSTYIKTQDEDLHSVITGITQQKGRIHMSVGKPVCDVLSGIEGKPNNIRFAELRGIIDRQISENYKLWKTNYIAYDLLNSDNKYTNFYSPGEKEAFKAYMSKQLIDIKNDKKVIEQMFLNMYANPVVNKNAKIKTGYVRNSYCRK